MENAVKINKYLPLNVILLVIAGLYTTNFNCSLLSKLHYCWRIISLFICCLLIFWIATGLATTTSFVLVESAPAILHLCNMLNKQKCSQCDLTFHCFSCVHNNIIPDKLFLSKTKFAGRNSVLYGEPLLVLLESGHKWCKHVEVRQWRQKLNFILGMLGSVCNIWSSHSSNFKKVLEIMNMLKPCNRQTNFQTVTYQRLVFSCLRSFARIRDNYVYRDARPIGCCMRFPCNRHSLSLFCICWRWAV